MRHVRTLLGALALVHALPVAAQDGGDAPAGQSVSLTPAQLFGFADEARERGDFETAEAAYRALATNPDIELRTEARFRLALMLADKLGRHRDAAVLLREILDEKPDAARVRVELARMQVALGNYGDAERELRAAQAAGLPSAVEQAIEFYAAALNARKPLGGSFQVAIAPDSNINRATTSETLGTIIGDFDLSEDAQAQSGIGIALRGQGYFREGLDEGIDLLVRVNALGRFYRESEFDDYVLALQAGPEYRIGSDRLSIAGTVNWRWFGQDPYTLGYGVNADYRHPTGERSRLTASASVIYTDDKLNDLRDNHRLSADIGLDRAFSARFGGGASLNGSRQISRDPGYSTASGGLSTYLYREFGETTLVLNMGYDHLEADKRLFLYPRRRVDDRLSAGLSATLRSLRVGSFAPIVSLRGERNYSTVEIYDYQRVAVEVGITAAF